MNERTRDDIEIISQALDEYMICKGRNVMTMESKMVWMKRLVDKETKVVLWAIESAIRTEGWPDLNAIFIQCKEYLVVHAEQIAEEQRKRFLAANLEYEKLMLPTLPKDTRTMAEVRKSIRDAG